MAHGDPLSAQQVARIEQAIGIAQRASGLHFSAYIGPLAEGRSSAESMLRSQSDAARNVLVAVDPDARTVDIVTGPEARRWLDDARCRLAMLTMQSRFIYGDIAGGLHDGMVVLGEQATHPTPLFTDQPA
jgi:hypothetical protein